MSPMVGFLSLGNLCRTPRMLLIEAEFANGPNQGLIDSAVFLVPRVHEQGVRVGRAYTTQGIQSDGALNGRVATLVPELTGLPQPLNTWQDLATDDADMPPLTRWPMEVAPTNLNGNPRRMRVRPQNLVLQPLNMSLDALGYMHMSILRIITVPHFACIRIIAN